VEHTFAQKDIVLSSETPSFTAFANTLMLFSSSRLGVPNAFYKFAFFSGLAHEAETSTPMPPQDEQYTAEFVLRNTRYGDILRPISDKSGRVCL